MNTGALYHWTQRDIEADVRIVMRAESLTDLSIEACKKWVHKFIQDRVPWWVAGQAVREHDERMIGAAFEARLNAAKRKRDGA